MVKIINQLNNLYFVIFGVMWFELSTVFLERGNLKKKKNSVGTGGFYNNAGDSTDNVCSSDYTVQPRLVHQLQHQDEPAI